MKLHMLLPLAVVGLGFAQGPVPPPGPAGPGRRQGPPPGGTQAVQQYLGLTDDQVQQIEKTRDAARTSTRDVADELRAREIEMRSVMESGSADAGAVGKLALEIEALRSQMTQAVATARQNVLALLTPEQHAKLQALEEAAKLRPAIDEAAGLGLLGQAPPQGPRPGGPAR
jgi:Spy/CpxP family protein refolding chaperone